MEAFGTRDIGYDLLDFCLDFEGKENVKENDSVFKGSSNSSSLTSGGPSSLPADEEEELEWLSNKDAFPAVEYDVLGDKPDSGVLGQHSPVSVLESIIINSNGNGRSGGDNRTSPRTLQVPIGFPDFARKKRIGRKPRMGVVQNKHLFLVGHQISVVNVRNYKQESLMPLRKIVKNKASTIGRRCLHCGSDKTPQWRTGPMGPKTLCNACGVRYKSGRLVPEYRPASSPTFSAVLHSNSHRKILEMRKLKQLEMGQQIMVKETF